MWNTTIDSTRSYNLGPESMSLNYFERVESLISLSNNIVNMRCDVESFGDRNF